MITIGLFEAKTRLSEICEQVAKRREAVVITRRGRPLVRLEPVGPGKGMSSSVWDRRDAWGQEAWTAAGRSRTSPACAPGLAPSARGLTMALSHLLDTSVYCQPIKPRPLPPVRQRWTSLGDDALAISAGAEAEVLYGLELKKSARLEALFHALLRERLRVLPVDSGVAKHFASLKDWAKANGRSPSDFDLLIGATARGHGLTLATLNVRHFQGLPGLMVEDWSQIPT